MGKITILKDKLIFERRDELTVIEAYGENCLRCRSTKNSKLLDENWTLLPPASESECFVEGDEKPLKQDSHGMGELFPIIGKTGKFFIQSLKGNIREEMYILREIIIRLKLFLMQMKGNIFTVSDKNRRISSIGKEAPVICSIIIQSQQFRLYILHLDMDFYGTTRHRDGVKQQTIIRCGWQIVPIRLII